MSDFGGAFQFIGDNLSLLLRLSGQTLLLSVWAVAVSVAIAVPLGTWLGHLHRFSALAINLSNVGRALPPIAVIAIGLNVLGLTQLNVVVTLVVLAVPPILTNAYVAVAGVDADAVEAARGMGMRPIEVLTRVELPLALPLIFAGIRTATIYVVGTSTIASLAGVDRGLGRIIFNQPSYGLKGVIGAAIVIAVLALLVELLFAGVQRLVTPRGLRRVRGAALGPPLRT